MANLTTLTPAKAYALAKLLHAKPGDRVSFLTVDDNPRKGHFYGVQDESVEVQEADIRNLNAKFFISGDNGGELFMGIEEVISMMADRRFFIGY